MELKRFANLWSQKEKVRLDKILFRYYWKRGKRREEGQAIHELYSGIRTLETNVNRLECRVAELELRSGDCP